MKVILTVAAPEADRDDASHLAVALGWAEGWTPEEWQEAFTVQLQYADGNLYRVMSCPVGQTFVAKAAMMGPIERPAQDVDNRIDLSKARRAQDKLVIWMGEGPVPQASADRIVAVVGMPGRAALEAVGLSPIPVDL